MDKENQAQFITNETQQLIDYMRNKTKKTGHCPKCDQDMKGALGKQIRNHVETHYLLSVCECGLIHSREHVVRLHQKKEHHKQKNFFLKVIKYIT